ncbi:hypothetical protein BDZ89DRAFT_1218217 [Hymenopellis radicata]|nr:hypothetical protein BDZ89DRAFT_1218217 [Hymenopellis radicata]
MTPMSRWMMSRATIGLTRMTESWAHAHLVANLEEKMEQSRRHWDYEGLWKKRRILVEMGEHAAEWASKKGTYVFFEGPGGITSGEDGSAAEDVTGGGELRATCIFEDARTAGLMSGVFSFAVGMLAMLGMNGRGLFIRSRRPAQLLGVPLSHAIVEKRCCSALEADVFVLLAVRAARS